MTDSTGHDAGTPWGKPVAGSPVPVPVPLVHVRGWALAIEPDKSNNPAMSPVVLALAQLVRDRYERDQREAQERRARVHLLRRDAR